MRLVKYIASIALVLGLSACGGGGSSAEDSGTNINTEANGVYSGTVTYAGGIYTQTQCGGNNTWTVTITDGVISGEADNGGGVIDGITLQNGVISGTTTKKETWNATLENGTILGTVNYDNGKCLFDLNGVIQDSSSTETPTFTNAKTGVFLDNPVQGLSYACSSGPTGITNAKGEFTCEDGDKVTFSLGNIVLGEVEVADTITPLALFDGDEDKAIRFAQLVQTLDSDGDPSDGSITLESTTLDALGDTIDFSSDSFEDTMKTLVGKELVTKEDAQQHLNETFAVYGVNPDGSSDSTQTPEPTPEPTPAPTPEPTPVPISISHNGFTYGVVTSPYTSKTWLDRNLGASQVCTAYNDLACYGDYYQWGRETDGHERSNSETNTTKAIQLYPVQNNLIGVFVTFGDWTNIDSGGTMRAEFWSTAHSDGSGVCPNGYRIPTQDELLAETTSASTSVGNRIEAFNNFLKLPSAGFRRGSYGDLELQSYNGFFWTSSPTVSMAMAFGFDSNSVEWYDDHRNDGRSIRCLKD